MFFSQTSYPLSSGNTNQLGGGLFGSTGVGIGTQSLNLSTNTQSQNSLFQTGSSNLCSSLFQTPNSFTGSGNSSNLFSTTSLGNSSSTGTGLSSSFGVGGPLLCGTNSLVSQTQAQYLPLNPTVGQLTNYIQSWKSEFDDIELKLRENDSHVEYLANNKLLEITRLCSTYKKGVERRNEEIENIKSRQCRVQDSIESIISEISTVQQLSHDLINIYDRVKEIDPKNSSRQIQPLRFPLPIFEFFCENLTKKCKYIEEMVDNLNGTVSSLREEMVNTTFEEILKYIVEVINNNYETFYTLVSQCSQLHDKTESILNISKLHEVGRN
ncbi:hypothetical protein FG386_000885 [Cryptosporidium ryanae]|uniref:uncharacterized protein n=1 Tax=Cryptosporidium ryanae TaxID=515981 RepID=UPI00351A1F44|nr:hypothetical protein FG386_000885 [Cryptosporidium ryanae]